MNKLEAMQIFMRVAEVGSFTQAADQLHLARSVVTRQVAALEKHLGVKLMVRSTRSLTLTVAGAEYLEQCRRILQLVDEAETSVGAELAQPRGRIQLGLPLSFGLRQLMPALLDFQAQYPGIDLKLDFSDQRTNLIEAGMDLTIRVTSRLQPNDIVRKLGECRLLTLASPAYLAQHGEPTHPAELSQHPCLIYSLGRNANTWVYREGDQLLEIPVQGPLIANNGHALLQAAARGMGITVQPDFIAAPFLKAGAVRPILPHHDLPTLGIYAVLPSNRYIPNRVRVLVGYLEEALRRG